MVWYVWYKHTIRMVEKYGTWHGEVYMVEKYITYGTWHEVGNGVVCMVEMYIVNGTEHTVCMYGRYILWCDCMVWYGT